MKQHGLILKILSIEGIYGGGDLNYLRGKLESEFFMEHSYKGKVFMYSIFAKEVRIPSPSNNDAPKEKFVYLIADMDGDSIFETLEGNEDLKVPKWVLK